MGGKRSRPKGVRGKAADSPREAEQRGRSLRDRVGSCLTLEVRNYLTFDIVTNDRLTYIGECQDFAQRFNTGYGQISPKNCFKGGQETTCRINQLILKCAASGMSVDAYFIETADPADRFALESAYIAAYSPAWNRPRQAEMTDPSSGSAAPVPCHAAWAADRRRKHPGRSAVHGARSLHLNDWPQEEVGLVIDQLHAEALSQVRQPIVNPLHRGHQDPKHRSHGTTWMR